MKQLILAVLLLFFSACNKPQPTTKPITTSSPPQPSPSSAEKLAEDFFTKDEKLSYNDYEIFKDKQSVMEADTKMDVTTILVKRHQKPIAIFDGPHHPIGNAASFGIFPLLGLPNKQLIVSLSAPRRARHFVADLGKSYRTIFDSAEWGISREELEFIDIDNDGSYEIKTLDVWFLTFGNLAMSESPMVSLIFKYDPTAKKYLPANHLFASEALNKIEERIQKIGTANPEDEMGGKVNVLLQFLYAGKEKEGWDFFERAYQAKDNAEIKKTIKNVLRTSPVYQYIQAHSKP